MVVQPRATGANLMQEAAKSTLIVYEEDRRQPAGRLSLFYNG